MGLSIKLPSTEEIKALHRKYAPTPGSFDLVFTHCQIVADIAQQLIDARRLKVNAELVRTGCLLHDIGLYELIDKSGAIDPLHVKHGILGYELLKKEGYPEAICRFASHHTGVGLSSADVREQKLPLPIRDYRAKTSEELLVMYADKFHSKTQPPCFVSFERYKGYVVGFGQDKVARFEQMAKQFGVPDIATLAAEYGHIVKDGGPRVS